MNQDCTSHDSIGSVDTDVPLVHDIGDCENTLSEINMKGRDNGHSEVGETDAVCTSNDYVVDGQTNACEEKEEIDGFVSTGAPIQCNEIFTCPICLCENNHAYQFSDLNDGKNQSLDSHQDEPKAGTPFLKLASSCNHSFCVPCLYAYIHSKLMDGKVDIKCCHFQLSDNEEDFHACNVPMKEEDIHRLIFTQGCNKESVLKDWCDKKDEVQEYLFCNKKIIINNQGTKSNTNNTTSPDELWTRFKKLQFDHKHGKDTVRRCPKCEEAQLFDVESMKEYQSNLLHTIKSDSLLAENRTHSRGTNGSRMVRQLERLSYLLRGRQENASTAGSGPPSATNIDTRGAKSSAATVEGNVSEILKESGNNISLSSENKDTSSCDPPNNLEHSTSSLMAKDTANGANPPQSSSPSLLKSTTPIVICQSCDTEFCYFHSNAHPDTTCEDYHKKNLEHDRANLEYANHTLHVKPCPNCGISVSKEGGCNQIKCGNCETHFCWLCSATVDDGAFPEHFRWWNLNGCPNMQLDESDEPYRCTFCAAKTLSVIQLIVLGVPSLVLALLTMLICPCLVRGSGGTNRERILNCVSFWGSFLSTLILFPFTW